MKNGKGRPEIDALRSQVRELTETLDAITSGQVDAIVVSEGDRKKVYTLEGADYPYRILIENIKEGALTLSADGMILYANASFARMRGLPLEGIPGTYFEGHVAPKDRETFGRKLRDALSAPSQCGITLCSGNGSLPVLVSMTPLDPDGCKKVSMVVTDRKEDAGRLLLQSRMLDSVADAVIAADPKGKIIYWNDAATRIYGWRPGDTLGHDLLTLVVPDLAGDRRKNIRNSLLNGESWSGEYIVQHKDGHRFPVHALDAPVFDDDGQLVAVVGASHDITDRKNAEEALLKKNIELNALNVKLIATQEELREKILELTRREQDLNKALAEKEVLLSEIHHRVKNNLTAFISLLGLRGSTEETPAGRLLKQDLQNRARSMALIHETLYRTNMYDEVDLGMYLKKLVNQIAVSFQTSHPVTIVVDAHGTMLDLPRATPAGLIVNELLTNSFKYAFPDSFDTRAIRNAPPTITINVGKADGYYTMDIRDNGIGLPAGIDIATTKTLGLKLVNFLARHQLKATIDVSSRDGTGFILRFSEKGKDT